MKKKRSEKLTENVLIVILVLLLSYLILSMLAR